MKNNDNLLLINTKLLSLLHKFQLLEIPLDDHIFYYFGLPTDLSYFNFLKKYTKISLLSNNATSTHNTNRIIISISDFIEKHQNTSFFNNPNFKVSFHPTEFTIFFNRICNDNNPKEIKYVLDNLHNILHISNPLSILDKPFTDIAFLELLTSSSWRNKLFKTKSLDSKNLDIIFNKLCINPEDSYESFHNFLFSFPKIFKNITCLISIKKFVENKYPHKFNEFLQQLPTSLHKSTENVNLIKEPSNLINLCINKEALYSMTHKMGIIDSDIYLKHLQNTSKYLLKILDLHLADIFVQGVLSKHSDYYITFVLKPHCKLNSSTLSNIFIETYLLNFDNQFNDSNIQSIINYHTLKYTSTQLSLIKNTKLKI